MINSMLSIGTNKISKDGAKLVIRGDDIIQELSEFNILKQN